VLLHISVLSLGILSMMASSEARAGNILMWPEDPYAWVARDASPPRLAPDAHMSTEQAVNEREHVSFVLKPDADVKDVRILISPLAGSAGTIGPEKLQLREVKWLAPADGPGFWRTAYIWWVTREPMPELLEDVTGPLELAAGEARHFWVTVDSHDVEPGRYGGTVSVRIGEETIASLPLRATVRDIELPLGPNIICDQWETLPAPTRLAEKYADFGDEHYVNIRLINYPDAVDGQLDWSHWDWLDRARIMGEHNLKVVIALRRRPHTYIGEITSRIDRDIENDLGVPFDRMLQEMVEKLNAFGVPTSRIYIYPVDEVKNIDVPLAVYQRIKKAVPDIRIIFAPFPPTDIQRFWAGDAEDSAAFDRLMGLVDCCLFFGNQYTPLMQHETGGLLDENQRRLVEFVRRQQRAGKEVYFYILSYRCSMYNEQLVKERFPFWVTWQTDIDGFEEGCTTGIWHHRWRYTGQNDRPVFTWQPPEHQMLTLVEHVRCLADGDFRMVSSKRLEAFADGVRDYIYLASLEQLARRACKAAEPATREAGEAALRVLAEQMSNVYLAPNSSTAYARARGALADAIVKLQSLGLAIETESLGRLRRYRRFRTFDIPALDPASPDNLALAANGGRVIEAPGGAGEALINGTLVPGKEYGWSTPTGTAVFEIALAGTETIDQVRVWQEARWWGEEVSISTAGESDDYADAGTWHLPPRKGGHQAVEVFRFRPRTASRVRLEFRALAERHWAKHATEKFDEERPWPFGLLEVGVYRASRQHE